MKNSTKLFVLDTNVLLHDYRSIHNFADADVVIPIIVLEELDRFKKGNDSINYHAREFMRELDRLSGQDLFRDGVSLGEGKGSLFIETGKPFSHEMRESFNENSADHRILAVADYFRMRYLKREVILVSQDINLRMKAKSLGILAQDYQTGKVKNVDALHKSISVFTEFDLDLINHMYQEKEGVSIDKFPFKDEIKPHQYVILKNNKSSILAHYDPNNRVMNSIQKERFYGILPRNAEQAFALDALSRPDIQLVTLTGKAGTGKTLLALAAALHQRKKFHQIFLARPIVPLANRDMGFLPGSAKEKIEPYMKPLFDNLTVIKQQFGNRSKEYKRLEEMVEKEKLLISPLAYIRGRSLSNIFFIVDEAQNLTPHEIKTIITRAGENTKMVFTGDIQQIDSPYLDIKSNGLSYLSDKLKGQNIFAHVNLVKGERSMLAELASNLL